MQAIITLTPEEATERLRKMGMCISPEIVRGGIQQGVFPFGDCIKTEKSRRFFVYTAMLDRWIDERLAETTE